MIFEILWEAAKKGGLILVEGGLCHFHKRKDGHITIHEIISLKPGAGSVMLEKVKELKPNSIVARCPSDLAANAWYQKKGFQKEGEEKAKTGRVINVWRLWLKRPKGFFP